MGDALPRLMANGREPAGLSLVLGRPAEGLLHDDFPNVRPTRSASATG